jgi:thiamine-phosphate pyrophosphorylase
VLPLDEIIEAVLAAGCRWISVREKDLPASEQIAVAARLRPMAQRFGACLILHGAVLYTGFAASILDGVHLPDRPDACSATAWRKEGKLVGRSVHASAQAQAADPSELDYLIAGPVHETASKPGYGPPLGTAGLADFVHATSLPVIAIGGIRPANIRAVMATGAAGIAVMGSVMRAREPADEMRKMLDALDDARSQRCPRCG